MITEQLDREHLSRTKPHVVQSILDRCSHPAHITDKRTKSAFALMGRLYYNKISPSCIACPQSLVEVPQPYRRTIKNTPSKTFSRQVLEGVFFYQAADQDPGTTSTEVCATRLPFSCLQSLAGAALHKA